MDGLSGYNGGYLDEAPYDTIKYLLILCPVVFRQVNY